MLLPLPGVRDNFTKIYFMKQENNLFSNARRKFLHNLAAGAATLGIASVVSPFQKLSAAPLQSAAAPGPDDWFNKIRGKHRIVFDATEPNDIMPFAWPKVFLLTNAATGTPQKDCNAVVVLRHAAIPYAFDHNMWEKYKFGEMFKADDHLTKQPATRNPFWKPAKGEYKVPGIGEVAIGINDLQEDGVMFCVCNMAMNVYSAVAAEQLKMDAAAVKAEWTKNLIPGIEVMPSGVWAVGRAQEKGCGYCFAG